MKRKLAMISLIIIILIEVLSFSAPLVASIDYELINMSETNQPPSNEYWLGTDRNGRDIFTRTLYGGRVSLTIGVLSTFFVTLIGSIIGSVSGYFGGWID